MAATATRKRRRKITPLYVIVPKTQMRAKKPMLLADPQKIEVIELTPDVAKAATFTTRSGAFRHVRANKTLSKRFWYRKIA